MNTTSSGAVGFAPVGTFVKDLALELGKSASTVAAYIKKHLPESLVKRKNANNRLANFAFEQAVEAVRAHYSPNIDNSLQQEIERLRARVQELEAENTQLRQARERTNARLEKLHSRLSTEVKDLSSNVEETEELLDFSFGVVQEQIQQQWRQANEDTRRQIRRSSRTGGGQPASGESKVIPIKPSVSSDI